MGGKAYPDDPRPAGAHVGQPEADALAHVDRSVGEEDPLAEALDAPGPEALPLQPDVLPVAPVEPEGREVGGEGGRADGGGGADGRQRAALVLAHGGQAGNRVEALPEDWVAKEKKERCTKLTRRSPSLLTLAMQEISPAATSVGTT